MIKQLLQKLFVLVVFIQAGWNNSSIAQTVITLGGQANTPTGPQFPIYRSSAASSYNYSRGWMVIPASVMSAAGIVNGNTISQVAWQKSSVNTLSSGFTATMSILMKNSTATAANATSTWADITSGMTTVYTNTAVTPPATAGYWTISLTTPIVYTGGALEIAVDWFINSGGTGSPATGSFLWNYSDNTGTNLSSLSTSSIYCIVDGNSTAYSNTSVIGATGLAYSTAGRFQNTQLSIGVLSNCSGTPAAGTISGPSSACSGVSFMLTNTGATTMGQGLRYAWQSSANGTSGWANIAGQTSPGTATVSQTAATYYRFVDTCSASGLSAISNVIQVAMNAPTACYCMPVTSCASSDRIDSVSFVTIANGSACSTNGYGDYTSLSAAISTGSTYPIAVKVGPGGTEYVGVWIDYDRSGTFDASEFTAIGSGNGVLVNGTITVPGSVAAGTTRMRVRVRYNTALTGADACLVYTYGETEDYTVTISAGSPCTGTPNGGSVTPAATQLCSSGSITLTSIATNSGTGITYQWQSAAGTGTNFANIAGANSSTYTATVSASTTYRVVLTCTGSGLSANSSVATVTVSGPPANDSFCNPIALTLNGAANCGNTTCATSGYDPAFSNSTPNNTVWYTYTPTTNGTVQARFKRPAGVTTGLLYGWLGIYTVTGACPGLSASSFTEVTSSLSYDLTTNDSVTVTTPSLTAGTTYYFMVDGVSGAFGAYCIQLITPPAPPLCTTIVSPATGATNVSIPLTLTWRKVADATGYDVYFSTTNPPPSSIGTATDTTAAISGVAYSTTYYWYVVPRNAGGTATGCDGRINSFTTQAPPAAPANDSCGAPIALTPGTTVSGSTISSTQSIAPSLCSGFTSSSAYDVWYTARALSNGSFTVTVVGNNNFDAVLGVYTGACNALVLSSCADATGVNGTETVTISNAVAGTVYRVRVYRYNNTTDSTGTFTITATGPALPVTGVSLTAARSGKNVQLGWQTLTEINNTGFEVQRSADGSSYTSFLKVATKANGGNSTAAINYTAEDVKPFTGAAYYRLKQTDKDGRVSYSNIAFVKGLAVSSLTLSAIYPNPTRDVLKAAIQSPGVEKVTFVISDMMGKAISRQVSTVNTGDNTISLNVASLPSGNYLLKAICSNGCETAVQKFTKQ